MKRRSEYQTMVSTAASRNRMADELISDAASYGFAIDREHPRHLWGKRCLSVVLARGSHRVLIDLDGDSAVTAFLAHWYTALPRSNTTYPKDVDSFATTVNQYHRAKATTCMTYWETFRAELKRIYGVLAAAQAVAA